MIAIITCIVGAVLYCYGIISSVALCVAIGAAVAWEFIAYCLYLKSGFLKFWYHDVLGWHMPNNTPEKFDGCSMHCICRYCGKDIMQDSQGNWF